MGLLASWHRFRCCNKPPAIFRCARRTFHFGQNRSTGALDVPRAQLGGSIVDINVCADDNCRVGTGAGPVAIAAILGSDNLIGDALRLRFDTSQIFILPNIGPRDNGDRTKLCNAVFASPFRGGGTLLLGSTEIPFSGRRIALTACAAADPRAEIPQGQRGTDLLLIASTAVGPTIIGEAYRRYQLAHATAPLLETLPVNSAWLPSGLIEGRLGSLPNLPSRQLSQKAAALAGKRMRIAYSQIIVSATKKNTMYRCGQLWRAGTVGIESASSLRY